MKKHYVTLLIFGIAVLILFSGCLKGGKNPEIFEFSISPETPSLGEDISITLKARGSKGLREIGVEAVGKKLVHDCGNAKICEKTWTFNTASVGLNSGEVTFSFEASDVGGNSTKKQKTIAILPRYKRCSELGAYVCRPSEVCTGEWLSVSDTARCCSVECGKPPLVEKTCSELFGFVCETGKYCQGSWLDARDSSRCCSIECSENIGTKKICIDLGGDVCIGDEICTGMWISASDTARCCSIECSLLEEEKTCSELGGDACTGDEICSGTWLNASDSDRCCSVECSEVPPSGKTCSELGGDICTGNEICKGDWLNAIDTDGCCSVGCEESENNLMNKLLDSLKGVDDLVEDPFGAEETEILDTDVPKLDGDGFS